MILIVHMLKILVVIIFADKAIISFSGVSRNPNRLVRINILFDFKSMIFEDSLVVFLVIFFFFLKIKTWSIEFFVRI